MWHWGSHFLCQTFVSAPPAIAMVQSMNFYGNRNFAQKSAMQKVWYYVLTEILLNKVRCRKCDLLCPVDRPNLHYYVLIEILLKKVRRRKCDLLGPVDSPNLTNYIHIDRNFGQKSGKQKVWPFGSVDRLNLLNYMWIEILLKKCDSKSVTL